MKKKKIIIVSILVILITTMFFYVNDYYHSENVDKYLISNNEVKVIKIKNGYYFDGNGENEAIIFYPGAKVEFTAYSQLMFLLAENGIDCYMLKMPLNIAFLGMNFCDPIVNEGKYNNYWLAGHSLGGVVASSYASKNSKSLKGLIYLASYSSSDLSQTNLKVLSIYGSKDEVIRKESMEKSQKYMPLDFKQIVIDGGNHAQFGCYGNQDGDGMASITGDNQIEQTLSYILEFVK